MEQEKGRNPNNKSKNQQKWEKEMRKPMEKKMVPESP